MTHHPPKSSAAYQAAEYLHREGPKTEAELLATGIFGAKSDSADRLQCAIRSGWLRFTSIGTVARGVPAIEHFASKAKFVGKVAAPRQVDLMSRKAYVPPKRLIRADAPDCSVRAWPSTYAKAGE
jgi:hypothetical protein